MKKILSIFVAIILVFSSAIFISAEETENNSSEFELTMQIGSSTMTVNGVDEEIDEGRDTAPVIENERTLVPIRAIIEAMGGSVSWDSETQTAELTYNYDTILLTIDSTTAYFNDTASELDTAPVIINGRTMLPIRFIAESFEFDVEWEVESQTVIIRKTSENSEEGESSEEQPEEAAQKDETAETETAEEEDTSSENGSNILVVYYSTTGTTEGAANVIAEALGADLFEIEPAEVYTDDDLDYNDSSSRVSREYADEDLRNIELVSYDVENWDSYDTVFVGYPIWWGIAAWPVSSFVSVNDFTGKTVIPFCTSASSGIGSSGSRLEEAAGTGEWLNGQRLTSGTNVEDITEWAAELGIN
ncbi:MAG: hypothetical protein LUC97_01510 [Clostridiales bacterium]|nr:hypothetical protein [Clostridiales bacterium]